ncbi:MAG: Rrf2 family transcriptional regulator [Cyclobacteriaceae bacterium]|nr:Rrf2 family transcriptional regulator [Cyclobacteriaceae bacterium]
MLSLTCKTAIKAVILLASQPEGDTKLSLKEISEAIGASSHTVGKFLQTLVRHAVIKSVKGPAGGFFITKAQKDQSIMSIVEAIDGKQIFTGCGLGLSQCSEAHPCPIHDQYKEIRDAMDKLFGDNTIASLCQSVHIGETYLLG